MAIRNPPQWHPRWLSSDELQDEFMRTGAMTVDATHPTYATAADVCAHFSLQPRAAKVFHPDLRPGEFLGLLVDQRLHVDAIRFLGLVLPCRKAVWWACTCVRYAGEGLR